MGVAIGILITIAVLVIISWPFFRSGRRRAGASSDLSAAAQLRVAREEIYDQIRQLEADFEAKIVREDEYSSHLRELRVRAAELMRAQDQLPEKLSDEDRLELDIQAARMAIAVPPDDTKE
ncbi:MAG: hypothetical protein HQ478_16160 [Chloroflexi bacterium]|nr:hypothetical protein [Chloroflexota bacterium]